MKPYQFTLAAALLLLAASSGTPVSSGEMTSVEGMAFSSQTRQRPRIRINRDQPAAYDYPRPGDYSWPGPGAVRHCVDWYATEYRPSGTVITPQMRCRWVRG